VGDFAADTAVEGQDGHYRACLSRDWAIWGPNGGYVAAIALRAAGAATPLRRPASFACHFLNVADFDVVDLRVTPLRATKRAASLRVSMTQKDRPILEAIAWVVGDVDGLEHDVGVMPDVPAPGALKPLTELVPPEDLTDSYPFWQNLESRPINWIPWRERKPGAPVWRNGIAFGHGRRSMTRSSTRRAPWCSSTRCSGPQPVRRMETTSPTLPRASRWRCASTVWHRPSSGCCAMPPRRWRRTG